jgi:hypothetical protein
MDARFLWMRQKRVQGSHFANLLQASQANQLMLERRLDPCMSEVFPWADIPLAHEKMLDNKHLPGNMAVLVARPSITTSEAQRDVALRHHRRRRCVRPVARQGRHRAAPVGRFLGSRARAPGLSGAHSQRLHLPLRRGPAGT